VLVDGRPICFVCGAGVVPTGPGRWRHLRDGEAYPERSKWLAPTPAELRRCSSYEQFAATYPWAVTTPSQWHEGLRRLDRYEAAFATASRRGPLAPGENPYLELVELLAAPPPEPDDPYEAFAVAQQPAYWSLPYGLAQMLNVSERRRELVQLFAWAIPTRPALERLARHAPILECAAGMGYWSALLQAAGADVIASDLSPPGTAANEFHRSSGTTWTEVEAASAVASISTHRDRTLLLCWPPHDDDASSYEALRAYRGDVFLYVGEQDGASGSVRFHRELAAGWELAEAVELPRWPRLRDAVFVYHRRAVRRRQTSRDRCPECGRYVATGTLGRCDSCFERRPPALALRSGRHRIEYSREQVDAMPPALRRALESSRERIR
jgi:hypothetical protein